MDEDAWCKATDQLVAVVVVSEPKFVEPICLSSPKFEPGLGQAPVKVVFGSSSHPSTDASNEKIEPANLQARAGVAGCACSSHASVEGVGGGGLMPNEHRLL